MTAVSGYNYGMTPANRGLRPAITRLAIWLGVFAVVVRCVIGSGVMPDPRALAAGGFGLVICTAGGAKLLPAAPDKNDAPQHDGGVCPFSAFTHLAAHAEAIGVTGAAFAPVLIAAPASAPRLAAALHAVRARAPPAIS